MRKLLAFTGMLIPALWLCAQTPIMLDENDLPEAGQTFLVTTANPIIEFNAEDTGEGHTWDFSGLFPLLEDSSFWIPDNETNPLYFFLWLTSDLAEQTVSDIENDLVTITDVYNFYWLDDDYFAFSGFAGSILGIPFPIWFETPETIIEFPGIYEQYTTFSTGFDIDIPDIGGWSELRERENTIDGWGTLITPAGTYDVLRVRSEILVTDTFSYDGTVIPVQYTTREYRWMAKQEGIPVLQISTQEVLGVETITAVTYRSGELTPVSNLTPDAQTLNIISPVHDVLQACVSVPQSGSYTWQLCSVKGQVVASASAYMAQGDYRLEQPASAWPAGSYVLQVYHKGALVAAASCIKD